LRKSLTNSHSDSYSYCQCKCNTDRDRNRDCDVNSNANGYGNRHSDIYTEGYSDTQAPPDAASAPVRLANS
jgi:hypothetical protein